MYYGEEVPLVVEYFPEEPPCWKKYWKRAFAGCFLLSFFAGLAVLGAVSKRGLK